MKKIWQIHEAGRKFGRLIDCTLAEGAQIITRRGKKVIVVLPYEEYERLTRRTGSLSEFLLASPLHGLELKVGHD